ncbi:hypothetical protein HYS00_02160 [Candidatus Microgenomates bacterium]|nr:hypothetical protein [Candidatus Microgenomates bacterium]
MQVDFIVEGKTVGTVGKLSSPLQEKNGLKSPTYLAGFDLQSLIDHAKLLPEYMQINPHATIKLDLTIENPQLSYADMVARAKATSNLLQEVEFVGKFKSNITVRFYFSSREKNITDGEAQADLEKIKKIIA